MELKNHITDLIQNTIKTELIPIFQKLDYVYDLEELKKCLEIDILHRLTIRIIINFINVDLRSKKKYLNNHLKCNKDMEELIHSFNSIYEKKFFLNNDQNAIIKWKSRTPYQLFPAYDYFHRYTNEPYFNSYKNKNHRVFAHKFNLINTINYSKFIKCLKEFSPNIQNNMSLNFYLWNRKTKYQLRHLITNELLIDEISINPDIYNIIQSKKTYLKLYNEQLVKLPINKMCKFPQTVHYICFINKTKFIQKMMHLNFTNAEILFWQSLDLMVKSIYKEIDKILNKKNNKNLILELNSLINFININYNYNDIIHFLDQHPLNPINIQIPKKTNKMLNNLGNSTSTSIIKKKQE